MANKKSATSAKKTSPKKAAPKTTTKVTTVTAVESGKSTRRAAVLSNPWLSQVNALAKIPMTGSVMAEFVGTFILASVILIIHNEPFYIFVSLIGIFMMFGALSGAHVNPAVTVGAWATRRIGWTRAVMYIVVQLLAAMLALVVMNAFTAQAPEVSQEAAMFGQTAPQLFETNPLPTGKEWSVLFAEMIGVAILGFAYASVLRRNAVINKVAGAFTVGGAGFLALAFASTAAAYVGGSASLNPAVSLTLKAIDFSNVWTIAIYVVASLIGAVIGFALYDLMSSAEAKE